MKYKALIFDLDGTAIPNNIDGKPSQRVVEAVHEAKKHVKVAAATGRSLKLAGRILKELDLDIPCILAGGTQLYDPQQNRYVWEKKLTKTQVQEIINIALDYDYRLYISDTLESVLPQEINIIKEEHIIYIGTVPQEKSSELLRRFLTIQQVAVHPVVSWEPDHIDIHITHKEATKKHAFQELLKILNIHENDVIAVGDSGNDIPLLEHAGFKVAMGNASPELKAVANYVAPTVDEDGLAHVIEKYILEK